MKKLIALLLALALSVSLVACTNDTQDEESSTSSNSQSQEENDDVEDESSDEESSEEENADDEENVEDENAEDENADADADSDVAIGDLYETFDTIFDSADIETEFRDFLVSGTQKGDIIVDNMAYFLGADDYTFVEAVACEPMMSSQAISFALIRANSNEEALEIAERLPTTVDPIKWVCVGVDAEDVQTAVIGDVVFLVMTEDSEKFIEAFNALAE